MAELYRIEQEFRDIEKKIECLKKVETELNTLKTITSEEEDLRKIEAIRTKLKNPKKADEAEHELNLLKKKLKQSQPREKPASSEKPQSPKKSKSAMESKVEEYFDSVTPVKSSDHPKLADEPKTPVIPKATAEYKNIPYFPTELLTLYTPVELINKGGFARVYRVNRIKDGAPIALKIPIEPDPAIGKSFLGEIENWQKLDHENIVRLLDCNILPTVYLEMEFCQQSLEELVKPLMVERAAYIIFEISRGLKHAHDKGIIHRDLKPSNILIRDDVPKISDWGLSRIKSVSVKTVASSFSPIYGTPEQYSPKSFGRTDERTDVFQLGSIFYELVTGELPFQGEDLREIGYAVTSDIPVPPSELNSEASDVESIILKCLQKKKGDRYQNITDLQGDLAHFLGINFKKSLNMSRNHIEKVKLCSDCIEYSIPVGNAQICIYYLKYLQVYVATPDLKDKIEEEIESLEFYLQKEVSIDDRKPQLDEIIRRARMGE